MTTDYAAECGGRTVGGTPTVAGETPALPFLERARATGSLTTAVPAGRSEWVNDQVGVSGSVGR